MSYVPKTVWVGSNPYGALLGIKTANQEIEEFRLQVYNRLVLQPGMTTREIEEFTGVHINRLQTRLATMAKRGMIHRNKVFTKVMGGKTGRAVVIIGEVRWYAGPKP